MPRYRKVSTVIWNDDKFPHLSDQAQLLFLFLLTHPHMTSVGAMRTTLDGLAAEKKWTRKTLSAAINELISRKILLFDESACCLVLPNFVKHNPPENPNVVKSWASILELVPECRLKDELIQSLARFLKNDLPEPFSKAFERVCGTLRKGYAKGYAEPLRKGMPKPEPYPEEDSCSPTPPPSDTSYPQSSSSTNAVNENVDASADLNGFEQFWREYPRKVGKQAALKAWKKRRPGKQLTEAIVKAIRSQVESCHFRGRHGEDFVPNPATWLNEGRWEDEIRTATPARASPLRPREVRLREREEYRKRLEEGRKRDGG